MELTTGRLTIRPVRVPDAEALYEIRERNWRRVGVKPRTLEETRAMLLDMEARRPGADPGWHQYAIVRHEDGALVGDIGVNFGGPGERQAEIGYSLHPDHWRGGYGTEAVGRILTHLFDDHALHRVVAITQVDNLPSRKLLARLGFRHEATTAESFFHHGEGRHIDEVGYAILAREWAAARI